jgi:hypothetical protein
MAHCNAHGLRVRISKGGRRCQVWTKRRRISALGSNEAPPSLSQFHGTRDCKYSDQRVTTTI